jgi:SAM-dependent methyltransferase
MGFYTDHILPRCIDFALSRPPILEARARITRGLLGDVLEIGFGSGLNLPYYPAEVRKVVALEPSRVALKVARERIAASAIPVEALALSGSRIDLPDASIDAALSTFTLCTIDDLTASLRELRRVLRPRGLLHFLEHGRSPDARVARMQDRLNPLQRFAAGGCNLNRRIDDQLRDAGFCLEAVDNYYLPGPKFSAYMFEGRAHSCPPRTDARQF